MHDHIWGRPHSPLPPHTHFSLIHRRGVNICAATQRGKKMFSEKTKIIQKKILKKIFSPKKINCRSLKLCMVCTHIREVEEDEEKNYFTFSSSIFFPYSPLFFQKPTHPSIPLKSLL